MAHLDNTWVYPGGGDYRGLLKENDLTAEIFARTDEVKTWIADATTIAGEPTEPAREIGSHCSSPFPCGFHAHCSRGIVWPEHPVDLLPWLRSAKRESWAAEGIVELRDVPDPRLSDLQLRVKEHTMAGTTYFDRVGATAALAEHSPPSYFLDFESVQFAVPRWKGTRPYQQIAFQFSVHHLAGSGQLSHDSFLDLPGDDPTIPLAEALIAACGEDGPVFVSGQNLTLADLDLRDYFDLGRTGSYRVRAVFRVPGQPEGASNDMIFSLVP